MLGRARKEAVPASCAREEAVLACRRCATAWRTLLLIAAAALPAAAGTAAITSRPFTLMPAPKVTSAVPFTFLIDPTADTSRGATVLVQPKPTNLRVPTLFFRCGADLDFDADVDAVDLNILLASFGSNGTGDLDFDGDTDSADLNLMLATFGAVCTPPQD